MIGHLRKIGSETKYMLLSVLSVGLALVLHTVHVLLPPLLAGLSNGNVHMEMHHGTMHQGLPAAGAAFPWYTILLLVLNGVGIFYALRMLWRVKREKSRGWHAWLCSSAPIASIVVGIGSGFLA